MQSRAASMTSLDKLDPSLTGMIRISTMICYASSRDGALLCPAQFPGAPEPLPAHD